MRAAVLTAALLLAACGGEAEPASPVCTEIIEADPYMCCPPEFEHLTEEQCLTEDYTREDFYADMRVGRDNGCRSRHRC